MLKHIQFKADKLTRAKVRNNIVKTYNRATDFELLENWYSDANTFCEQVARDNGLKVSVVMGIVSALSPRKEWTLNKRITLQLIKDGDCGQIKQFVNKALRILDSDGEDATIRAILNGQKITSFYMNMRYPDSGEYVTVDRHAIAVALGRIATDEEQSLSKKQYEFLKDCYVWTAEQLGIKPLLLQSITWVAWKRIK